MPQHSARVAFAAAAGCAACAVIAGATGVYRADDAFVLAGDVFSLAALFALGAAVRFIFGERK